MKRRGNLLVPKQGESSEAIEKALKNCGILVPGWPGGQIGPLKNILRGVLMGMNRQFDDINVHAIQMTGVANFSTVRFILIDEGEGAGRLIIEEDTVTWCSCWVSMGGDIKHFIRTTGASYFSRQLCPASGEERERVERMVEHLQCALAE